ncbi:MAG: hypothetical protein AB7K09_07310 [Planctomycetota bacterium]
MTDTATTSAAPHPRTTVRRPWRAAACAIVATAVLVATTLAAAQDPPAQPDPPRPPADDSPVAKWAKSINDVPFQTLPGEPLRRTCLRATNDYLWFVRIDWPDAVLNPPAPARPDDAADADPDDVRRRRPPPPQPTPDHRVLCRQRINSGDAAAGATPVTEVLELGHYPHAYVISADRTRVAAVRQTDDTNGDGRVDHEDARTLWVARLDPQNEATAPDFQPVYTGSPQLVLAALLPLADQALVIEPGSHPFVNRILRVPLQAGAQATELTTGMYVECITPDENHAVVVRPGARPEPERFPWGGRGQPAGIADGESDDFAIARPPVHVLVSLVAGNDPEPDVVLLPGEDWSRIVDVDDHKMWIEQLVLPPQYAAHRDHPTRQTRNLLSWMDRENLTRSPITSDGQYDDQYVAQLHGHGTLYLHNTNINRHLMVHNDEFDRHFEVREISPMTPEFVLSPDGKRLWFFEYAAERGPFRPLLTPTTIRWLPLTRD